MPPAESHSHAPQPPSPWMARALELAARGLGRVEPNPMVGAVIVKHGRCIGEGWHRAFGGPHAEVEALNDAKRQGHDPAGSTCYVTLEPCSHVGKQPPCADALIRANVARVVAAMTDPHIKVSGGGFRKLQQANITTATGDGEEEARQLNRAWLKHLGTGLPWVIAKWAQTLDGKVATATGDSQWISNPTSRRRVHQLRARVDAIIVGVNTAIADNPQLTARDVPLHRTARRVIIDPNHRLPPHSKLLHDNGPPVDSFTNPQNALETLGRQHHALNVLVEGGPTLIGSMIDDQLIDELWVFIAPKLLADHDAFSAARGKPRQLIQHATLLHLQHTEHLDGDLLLKYLVSR
ncbi:MAG: bifunctional diaminohydroxyphosphoribosylaminopyrimidine deaminase/5-amino-6-(5-phosphoribosylamino)uracil reductase RibD [Phycisphaeraceae bacterium]